jgi:serine/threonine protein kinase
LSPVFPRWAVVTKRFFWSTGRCAPIKDIIHRDLKPANIKIRPDGTVKVLDFGLAKAMEPAGAAASSASISPTLSLHATPAAMILGTAAYMSPEQAAGKPIDRRSDLWSFGVVLLEALTVKKGD